MGIAGIVGLAAKVIEVVGVLIIPAGILVAVYFAVGRHRAAPFRVFRQDVGRAILLGLEFLVAADIIRTVTTTPTLRGVAVLAVIVLIRTFLSFTLEVEVEGRWPWQRPGEREPSREPIVEEEEHPVH